MTTDYKPNMQEVVINKDELLKVLYSNKEKHDTLYELSVSGYWDRAKVMLQEKTEQLGIVLKKKKVEVLKEYRKVAECIERGERIPYVCIGNAIQAPNGLNFDIKYPESHSNDYIKAIKMLELSVHNTVTLSSEEFDKYVMNNWSWKGGFITGCSFYTYSGTTTPLSTLASGVMVNF